MDRPWASGGVLVSNSTIDSAIVMSTGGGTYQGWEHGYPYDLARRIIALSCFVEGIVTQKHIIHQSEYAVRAQQEAKRLQATAQFMKNLPVSLVNFQSIFIISDELRLQMRNKIIDFFLKRPWHQNNFTPVSDSEMNALFSILSMHDEDPIRRLVSIEDVDPVAVMATTTIGALDASFGYGIPLLANAYEYPAFMMKSMDSTDCNTYKVKVPSIFSAILKKCRNHLDILKMTLQFRAGKAAQSFQELFVSIDHDENLVNFDKELEKMQNLADELADEIDEKPREITVRFIITSMPQETFTHRKRRLFFCLNTFQEKHVLEKMKEPISQVFNIDGEITVSLIKELLA